MAGSKVLKPVAGVVILVGLYAAAGYIGVPAGVRWAVSNVVPDALGGRDATVGDVSFNPWNWSLEINDLAIKSAHAPKNNLLTLKHLSADLSGSTLTEMAPTRKPKKPSKKRPPTLRPLPDFPPFHLPTCASPTAA